MISLVAEMLVRAYVPASYLQMRRFQCLCCLVQVKSLLSKFRYMREMDPSLQELQWDGAVKALTSNAMDVAAACYAIQSEWLQPLYEFIFSEYKKVAKTDMEEVKKIILDKKDLYSLDVRVFACLSLLCSTVVPVL